MGKAFGTSRFLIRHKLELPAKLRHTQINDWDQTQLCGKDGEHIV
jgi:hypothetical protein